MTVENKYFPDDRTAVTITGVQIDKLGRLWIVTEVRCAGDMVRHTISDADTKKDGVFRDLFVHFYSLFDGYKITIEGLESMRINTILEQRCMLRELGVIDFPTLNKFYPWSWIFKQIR